MQQLTVEKREKTGSKANSALRDGGKMPGVVYGRTHESTSITLGIAQFEKVWKEAGESSVITLKGSEHDTEVLINDVDVDPVTGHARHVDFYAIEKGKKVEVEVPLAFEGIAPAEKELGGIVIKVLHDLPIEAFPKDLPHEIVVDLTVLKNFESQILVKDLILPAGVTATVEPEEVVVTISQATEEPEEPAAAPDLSAIEISEDRGKKEEEEPSEEK